jgi:hypothetical protein
MNTPIDCGMPSDRSRSFVATTMSSGVRKPAVGSVPIPTAITPGTSARRVATAS